MIFLQYVYTTTRIPDGQTLDFNQNQDNTIMDKIHQLVSVHSSNFYITARKVGEKSIDFTYVYVSGDTKFDL